ncbi:MAG: hypothetical protein EPN61_05375 [Burkholderiaceae bacterium]|nr:MAG: hypothetical protein EPN61_05375 [Burkholderiaceae bacterium]
MQTIQQHVPRPTQRRSMAGCLLATVALVLTASLAMPQTSVAAEMVVSGSGSFKPPSAQQLAPLPDDSCLSRADLASGKWSFSVRYNDSMTDSNPDPYLGRYGGAFHAFSLVLGGTTINFPVDQALILVSDGGGGFPNRESIRLEATTSMPCGLVHLSWIQINQQPQGTDLRGPAGVLASDALPPYAKIANLPVTSPFDRYLELRIDSRGVSSQPLLYLSSSKLSVTAGPATAP